MDEASTWNWNKHLWTLSLLQKLKFFLWKIATNSLPTGANLQSRGLLVNMNCMRCGAEETIEQFLFYCENAKEVWKLDLWSISIDTERMSSFKDTLQASCKWVNLPPPSLALLPISSPGYVGISRLQGTF